MKKMNRANKENLMLVLDMLFFVMFFLIASIGTACLILLISIFITSTASLF